MLSLKTGQSWRANRALLDLLGYERDRYVGQPFGDFTPTLPRL